MTEGSDGFRAWYDYNGNMVGKIDPLGDEFVYSYDEENQLVRAVKNGTHVEEFIYDANGMRVRRIADGAATEYFYDGVNLLYEETAGVGTNYVWANGTLLCTVKNGDYTYYHTDHLGTSKLQTDDKGAVLSLDITKPYGPVAKEGVLGDGFNDLTRIDAKKSKFTYDQAAGAIRPPKNAKDLPKFVADNGLVTVTTTAYEKVKTIQAVLTEEDKGRKFTIRFSHRGKARLRVTDEAGNIHLEKEYSSVEEAVQTEEVKLKKKSGSVLVAVLELASPDGSTPAENRIFEVSYGQAEFEYGVVQTLPVSFNTTINSVRLSYTGTGVVFQVSTDGGTKWQKIEPGREVMLDEPGDGAPCQDPAFNRPRDGALRLPDRH